MAVLTLKRLCTGNGRFDSGSEVAVGIQKWFKISAGASRNLYIYRALLHLHLYYWYVIVFQGGGDGREIPQGPNLKTNATGVRAFEKSVLGTRRIFIVLYIYI